MAKTCPNCGYRPIGPFTDNCPICAEPVRNVRSDRPGFGGSSSVMKWVIGGVVAVVLAVIGCCGLLSWQWANAVKDLQKQVQQAQAAAEADRKARTVVVAAADLLAEFQKDPAAADQKYLGMYLEITGVVERVGKGRFNASFVILHAGDENVKLKIECFFDMADPKEEDVVRRLGKGQKITVRGEYDGQVTNVQLRDCVLVKENKVEPER